MSKILMFLNEVKRENELFYSISSFLAKFTNKADIEIKDVTDIKSKVIENTNGTDITKTVYYVVNHLSEFKNINRPQNLYTSLDGFEIEFCVLLRMNVLRDVSELSNLLLIKQYYKDYKILLLIQGEQGDYHKVSLFCSTMSRDVDFYNSVYYQCLPGRKLQRLKKNSIGGLRRFLPVQKVDCRLLELFASNITEHISIEWIKSVLMETSDWKNAKENEILYGSLTLIDINRKCFAGDVGQELVSAAASLNVLSWLFFSYTLGELGKKEKVIGLQQLRTVLQQMKLYATGCLQLLENIVFHSSFGEGVFSFRICSGESDYILDKYNENDHDTAFLEVVIADYSDGFDKYNIAQNFVMHITDSDLKKQFEDLTPEDFFSGELNEEELEQSRKRWASYYENGNHIGKHFGIRIFENIVRQSKGRFTLESHAGHLAQKGESQKRKKSMGAECLPGTQYTILLPIKEVQNKLLGTDVTIDPNIDVEGEALQYLDLGYHVTDKALGDTDFRYYSQKEKESNINSLAGRIVKICTESAPKVWFVNASGWKGSCGEIFCKAVLLSKINLFNLPHWVIYNCENEVIESCIQTMAVVFRNRESVYTLQGNGFQMALFAKDTYDEVILVPDDYRQTVWLNEYLLFPHDIAETFGNIDAGNSNAFSDTMVKTIPFDVLYPIKINDETKTLFEYYTKRVIERDIQGKEFGCKISDTHMRLGSTVHVNVFYEAELLFGNKLFVSRFVYLIVKDLSKRLRGVTRLTLYGYATYSELLVFEIMNTLRKAFGIADVDYAILEREMEDKGDSHVDRIRYSHYDISMGKEYFNDRKLVCIVPIVSTLKTNEKMISIFCGQNGEGCADNIIEHYALILAGPDKKNNYWKTKKNHRIHSKKVKWKGIEPKYFVKVSVDYNEAMECKMCFPPDNPLNEKPLVEVNAASTIPNQAFGLYGDVSQDTYVPGWTEIAKEQSELECLKDSLIYSHVTRGENHYLYYFQSEKLRVQYNDEIEGWLKSIEQKISLGIDEYQVIFCPSHFSNAGYLEVVNRIVFHNAAIIIRDDVDKEYRSNIMVKYSNLHILFEHLESSHGKSRMIKFYFVDDSIITGRTFWRSKSLVESVAGMYTGSCATEKIHVFEKIFVLIDRNSRHSRMQYLRNADAVDEDFLAFRSVRISSLRTHGDSCVICNLKTEAEKLYAASSTLEMASHWRNEKEKFRVKPLRKYLLENKELSDEKKERAYRRMVCTHTIHTYINDRTHGNRLPKAAESILQLLVTDYTNRSEDGFEYFLSYLKVMSRPFIVFNKCVKQAIFDILLLFIERQLTEYSMQKILNHIGKKKAYLQGSFIKQNILDIEQNIFKNITEPKDKKDLTLVLLKQLTELKSNYIIRLDNMNKIARYAEGLSEDDRDSFYDTYLWLVKLLICVNSDTSKSTWFDYVLHHEQEYKSKKKVSILLPWQIRERMYLENTRVVFDGIEKLCLIFQFDETVSKALQDFGSRSNAKTETRSEEVSKIYTALTDYQFGNFKQILKDYGYIVASVQSDEGQNGLKPGFTSEGKRWILSCMCLFSILSLVSEEDGENVVYQRVQEEILEKCRSIVLLLENILCADSVKIVMESDAEYNEWMRVVCEHYNELAAEFQQTHTGENMERLEMPRNKEYVLLADSRFDGGDMQDFEIQLDHRMKRYAGNERTKRYGYYINDEENYFIWQMDGGLEHPIFIYAELKPEDDIWKRRNNIRNAMMFNYMLNEKIFSNNDGGQLYELITNCRDLRMSNRSKAHSHTKNDVRMKQYEQVCGKDKYQKYYQSNILTLLADLNVSEIYRKSLKKDYYLESCDVRTIKWNDTTSIFKNAIDFFYIADKIPEPVQIEICMEKKFIDDEEIGDKDELLCYNVANAGREVYLLLFSLILNAGVAGRSRIVDNKITVYLSKTRNGDLRIANLAGQTRRDINEINEDLRYPPSNEDKGISLWSMSRYIKGIIYSILQLGYEELNTHLEDCRREDVETYKKDIEQLLGDEFEVKASWAEYAGERYFSLEVPVFAGKYQRFLKLFNAKRAEGGKNEEISTD